MNFARAGIAHHADNFAAGGAADDGVVYQHDALAFQQMPNRIQFELDAKIANSLRRFNERAANVMVTNKGLAIWNTRFGSIADGGGNAGIGYRNHDVCVDGMFASQQAPHKLAGFRNGLTKDDRIGPRKVDVFKDAVRRLFRLRIKLARSAFGTHNYHFARKSITFIRGAD